MNLAEALAIRQWAAGILDSDVCVVSFDGQKFWVEWFDGDYNAASPMRLKSFEEAEDFRHDVLQHGCDCAPLPMTPNTPQGGTQ